ncbi:host-nuclease inhibitor Gam family protein [Roseateles sp. DXS20W]|uniref:Host-nuclease inhibitor Gam family protein n=1 Tax=Pelomonas lactea TaxID=3299030 RepID=A0ABW7GK01_9BURK
MATKKLKAPAGVRIPQSRDEAAQMIHEIGVAQRQVQRITADMNDELAAITAKHQPVLDGLAAKVKQLAGGVQAWCEANRDEITNDRKVKFANLLTGMVTWRVRPPSVTVSNVEAVIKTLKALSLHRFLRTKDEVDKDAILAAYNAAKSAPTDDPNRARLVAEAAPLDLVSGISIKTGVEDFAIEPFEQEVAG